MAAAEEIEAIEVDTAEKLRTCLNPESTENGIYIKLTGNITLDSDDFSNVTAAFSLGENAKNVTLDLNGRRIGVGECESKLPLFYNGNSNSFTITDTSSAANGCLISAQGGKCIQTTYGTLNILGGSFQNAAQCLDVSNTTVNISGGSFETDGNGSTDVALMMSGNNTKVTITGGTFTSKHGTIWVNDNVNDNKSFLKITDGTFTASEKESYSYVCYVGGQCDVDISGGTFNLEPASGSGRKGSSLVLGANATDDMVSISGGTFHGRIARGINEETVANYEVFYGDGSSGGILAEGYVLTDNTFSPEDPDCNMYFTQEEVQVVPGDLIKLNTRRTSIEEGADPSVDWYSLDPISVGTDGTVYVNTNPKDIPSVDTGKIADGNTYTFYQWYDTDNKTYESIEDYIKNGHNAGSGQVSLKASWQAETAKYNGLLSAVKNTLVDNILVTDDIELDRPVVYDEAVQYLRRLDLDGHTLSYTSDNTDSTVANMELALYLDGKWHIKNGSIQSENAGCLRISGAATIENLNCLAENAPCVAYFEEKLSLYPEEKSQILSGIFKTTAETGHAIYYLADPDREDIPTDITEILAGPYISSTGCTKETVSKDDVPVDIIYLDAYKLIVSQTPITYIESGADVDMGTYVYGEDISKSEQSISNEDYIGDITITGISVDNPVFKITGVDGMDFLEGGSDAGKYIYSIEAVGVPDVGSHTGTVKVSYKRMDGSTGEYTQKVSLIVTPKQLTIADTAVTREKVYDKTTTAQVQAGTLAGVVDGDDVSVTATAAYDSADAGSGKKITVSYNLDGTDKGNYLAPVNEVILDGIINKADGVASVSMPDYHVGETAPAAVLTSETNKTTDATCYYKQKEASDDTYTTSLPTEEGNYTIKAVFAENQNYNAVEVQADFTVSYIDTPQTAYTLSGTVGQDGWYTSEVVIYPAQGYLISDSADGVFTSSYTVKVTAEPIIWLKNENGAVTRPIQVEKILIDTGMPQIKDDTGKKGWDVIKDEVDKSKDGGTVVVEMKGTSVVPGNVFDEIKGKNVTIVFDMGGGITWSVNGQSITGDRIGDIDFSVTVGTNTIPVDVINNVTGERKSQQISLAYEGEFGFTAVLSINMDKKNAGLYANLFYYNEKTGKLEFICADKIAEDGTTELTFTHASDYIIVIDETPMDGSGNTDNEDDAPMDGSGNADNKVDAPDTGDRTPVVWLFVLVVLSVTGLTFAVKKSRIKALIK